MSRVVFPISSILFSVRADDINKAVLYVTSAVLHGLSILS